MIFFFYGADDYRVKEKIRSVVAGYRAKNPGGLNFGVFDLAEKTEYERFKDFISACSIFAEKKLALINNLFDASSAVQEEIGNFINQKENPGDRDKFIVIGQFLRLTDKRSKEKYILGNSRELFKMLLGKDIQKEEFDLLTGAKLENWIKKECEMLGGQIESAAAKTLADFIGSDLWRMKNEIEKLISYRPDGKIGAQDVSSLVKSKIESDIFLAIDSLAAKKKDLAFKLLHKKLAQGESEIYLLSMFVYQFRNLLLVKSLLQNGVNTAQIGQKIKLHPFVLKKTLAQAQNFSLADLKKIYAGLLETDISIKNGRLAPAAAVDLMVAEITR